MIFLGSDWHFSKEAKNGKPLRYNIERNNEVLEKYKRTVSDNDIFIFLGDLAYFGNEVPQIVKSQINRIKNLPGRKILIRGNNDYEDDSFYIKNLKFDLCQKRLIVGNIIFTHEPVDVKDDEINIHGHIHASLTYWDCKSKNHADCYTPAYDNYPVLLEDALTGDYSFVDRSLVTDKFIQRIEKEIEYVF